jgi:hypothetical protein
MEAAGLGVGVVAFMTLFSACIECFDCVDRARNCKRDAQILVAKLLIQKCRLQIWGDFVGVADPDQSAELRDVLRQTMALDAQIRLCLENIKLLFTDSERLIKDYGLEAAVSGSDTNQEQHLLDDEVSNLASKLELCLPFRPRLQARTQKRQRFLWAIRDKDRFIALVEDVRDFVDGLYDVIPAIKPRHKRLVARSIQSIEDLDVLGLAQEATQHDYPGEYTLSRFDAPH